MNYNKNFPVVLSASKLFRDFNIIYFSQGQRGILANPSMRRSSRTVSESTMSESAISGVTMGSGTVTSKSLAAGSMVAKSVVSIKAPSRVSLVEMTAQADPLDIVTKPKNFYKRVYENKDVNKLHKQLCNCINSSGKVTYFILTYNWFYKIVLRFGSDSFFYHATKLLI